MLTPVDSGVTTHLGDRDKDEDLAARAGEAEQEEDGPGLGVVIGASQENG